MRRRCRLTVKFPLIALAGAQALLGARVLWRLARSAKGERILAPETLKEPPGACVSVILPVLDERWRVSSCLEGLLAQGAEVGEILVVDGGSCDGTQEVVSGFVRRDPRVRLLDASPIPADWNGKAWGLHMGLEHARPDTNWILTVDADVLPRAPLTRALLAQARRRDLPALSVATLQDIEGTSEGLLHPALLTTLVYRFGIPGGIMRRVQDVQANGQCFLFRRDALLACGGFTPARDSICEDVTIARMLVSRGYPIGFYEAGDLVRVRMYNGWRETWQNWTRSLPMRDRFSGPSALVGWLEVALAQALPLPLFLILFAAGCSGSLLFAVNGFLAATRIGVLFGTARAYHRRPWSYWLSPLCDLPVALALGRSALRRRHVWRGRVLIRGGA